MRDLFEGGGLGLALRHRIGGIELDVAFTLASPWTVLFAPSGAGKTTVLRAIAGLLRPDSGCIVWHPAAGSEVILTDTAHGRFVAPHRRGIRLVAQQAALFPHLSVFDNVDFASAGRDRVEEVLALCRVSGVRHKMPAMLSGGERQRVAIARALAPAACRLLLLDEPFSGLDSALRDAIACDLRPWLAARGIPVLHVTHDAGEAFALDAEVVRMDAGRVAAQGAAAIVLKEERQSLLRSLHDQESPGLDARRAAHGSAHD